MSDVWTSRQVNWQKFDNLIIRMTKVRLPTSSENLKRYTELLLAIILNVKIFQFCQIFNQNLVLCLYFLKQFRFMLSNFVCIEIMSFGHFVCFGKIINCTARQLTT